MAATLVGCSQFHIASIFVGSGRLPDTENVCPKYDTDDIPM